MKLGRASLLSLVLLLLGAAPASAAPVLAAAKPWHYWSSIVLFASFLGLLGMLALGYLVRVTMPKHGIRIGKRSEG